VRAPVLAVATWLSVVAMTTVHRGHEVEMKKLTPVLTVESIEPALPFWEDRLGFQRTMEVPGERGLAFAGFQKDGVEIMYQTLASVVEDLPALADLPLGGNLMFIEIDDIDGVEVALEGADIVRPRRKTFYGSTEIVVREPGGNLIIFAEMDSD